MTTSTSRRSSSSAWSRPTRTGTVHVVASTRACGDFHLDRVPATELGARRRSLVDLPWTMLDEVHGVGVVEVTAPGSCDRTEGDVLVTDRHGAALGVWVGDCAPVVLVASDGRFAVVHAGWRGLAAGVLDVALAAVGHGHGAVSALLGPCIGPCCYEFGAADLGAVVAGVGGASIAATTSWGTPALDVPGAVAAGLGRRGVSVEHPFGCTGCGGEYFSHRARGDLGRHVVVAWKEQA